MVRLAAPVSACLVALTALAVPAAPASHAATDAVSARCLTYRVSPSSSQTGDAVTMAGEVASAGSGREVLLQQETAPGEWTTVKKVRTNAAGRYSAALTMSAPGTRSYRAQLVGPTSAGAMTSSPRDVAVVGRPGAAAAFASQAPTVTGVHRVGERLTAMPGTWAPRPAKFAYQWRRDGARIKGATRSSYLLSAADHGAYVTVEVRASRNGASTTRESTAKAPVADGVLGPARVTVRGDRSVGSVLTAVPTTRAPAPEVVTYQWTRDGTPIPDATSTTYVSQAEDVGTQVGVTAVAHRTAFRPVSMRSGSVSVAVPAPSAPPPSARTFGELMRPGSTTVLPGSVASVTFTDTQPEWFANDVFVRWDTPGAFTHSLDPVPYGTLHSAAHDEDVFRPEVGGEYHLNNSFYKAADVSFVVTGKEFAVRYWTYRESDAMLWIDGVPVAAEPFVGKDPGGHGRWNWLVVSRSSSVPAMVRLAGPLVFSGVDHDACSDVTVSAAPRFTLGVISDSMFEDLSDARPAYQGAASMLSTLTGFRVWNMAEGATGYVNDGTGPSLSGGIGYPGHLSSSYGSARRIASIASAPIDALLVNGSLNDRYWRADVHRVALDAFLDAVAEARPDLPVVLVTLEPLSFGGVQDQTYLIYQAINANFAAAAANHPNVVGVIDPYAADWITGTGSTTNPKGDGNQDQYVGPDNVHLTAAGQAYYQGRIVEEMQSMLSRRTP